MPKVDQLVNNFAVYEDAVDYIGIAEVEFPELVAGGGNQGRGIERKH